MIYIVSFSREVDEKRVPVTDEHGREITIQVEAPTKTMAMKAESVVKFCQENNCRIRRVM